MKTKFVGTMLCYGSGLTVGYGLWGDHHHYWLFWTCAVLVFMLGRWVIDEAPS